MSLGAYKVRLTKEVIINTAEINTQPRKFYSSPRLTKSCRKTIWYYWKEKVLVEKPHHQLFPLTGTANINKKLPLYSHPMNSDSRVSGGGVTEYR